MQNQTLTKSEMTVMNILWEMPDGGTVYDEGQGSLTHSKSSRTG